MMNTKPKMISIILFVISIAIVPIAFSVSLIIGEVDIFGLAGMSFLWISFLFLPIPLISVLFGFSKKIKKNIFVGFVTTFVISAMGICSLALKVDRSGSFLKHADEITYISLPSDVKAMSYMSDNGRKGNAKILNYSEEQIFVEQLLDSSEWTSDLPPASIGLLPTNIVIETNNFDMYCVFLTKTRQFNPTVIKTNSTDIVFIAYRKSQHRLFVFDCYEYKA